MSHYHAKLGQDVSTARTLIEAARAVEDCGVEASRVWTCDCAEGERECEETERPTHGRVA